MYMHFENMFVLCFADVGPVRPAAVGGAPRGSRRR